MMKRTSGVGGVTALCGAAIVATALVACGAAGDATDTSDTPDTAEVDVGEAAQMLADDDDANFELTPIGRFHKTCIHKVPNGATVGEDGSVTDQGRRIAKFDRCRYAPRDVHKPIEVGDPDVMPTIGHQWVAFVSARAVKSKVGVSFFSGMWNYFTVPPNPPSNGGQTVFFFPAFQNSPGTAIIQPVLQWGPSAIGGGNRWTIASWYIDHDLNVYTGPLYNSGAGHVIRGGMDGGSCADGNSSGICTWKITTQDQSNLFESTLIADTREVFSWAAKGALEVWNLTSCRQLPNTTSELFRDTIVYEPGAKGAGSWYLQQNVTAKLAWSGTAATGVTPACGFGASSPNATDALLEF